MGELASALFATISNSMHGVSLLLTIIQDIVLLLLQLLHGRLSIGELWERVAQPLGIPAAQDPPPQEEDNPSKPLDPSFAEATEPQWKACAVRDLCRAIVSDDVERVVQLLQATPMLANVKHPLGWYPLHAAVLRGDATLVKKFLGIPGIDLRVADGSRFTKDSLEVNKMRRREELHPNIASTVNTKGAKPLHFACMSGNWEIIQLLIEHDPQFELADDSSRKPFEYFEVDSVGVDILRKYTEASEQWKKKKAVFSAGLSEAITTVHEGSTDLCIEIMTRNPEVLRRSSTGWTLLHVAVIHENEEVVKTILERDPSSLNSSDWWDTSKPSLRPRFADGRHPHMFVEEATALHYACMTSNLVIIKRLLDAGADYAKGDSKKRLPEAYIYEAEGGTLKAEYKRLVEEKMALKLAAEKQKAEKERVEREKREKEKAEKEKAEESKPDSQPTTETNSSSDATSEAETPEPFSLPPLETVISAKIIGQHGPVRSVASAIRLRENGWVDPDRPLVLLFLGSSGVGKTEVAKQVALYMANKNAKTKAEEKSVAEIEKKYGFIRIDMSEYQQSHATSNLIGSPKGYVGYEDGGFLTSRLRKNSKAVVLLDEIEKAHPNVLTLFLQVFDDGRLTDSSTGTVLCKDAVFIMTSNLGADEIKVASPMLRQLVAETEDRPEEYMRRIAAFNREIHPILKKSLKRDEFLGRINQIVVFLPLDEAEIGVVVNNELGTWKKRAEERHKIKLTWSPNVVAKLSQAYDLHYGVRSVIHEVHRVAVQLIADSQIRGQLRKNWLAHLQLNGNGDIAIKTLDPTFEARHRRGCRLWIIE